MTDLKFVATVTCHNRRSCKNFSSCVNFSRKQRNSLQNLRRNMKFTQWFGKFILKLLKLKISTVKSHLACTFTKIMQENALLSGKIYTADKNFTRPTVATVVTNFNSGWTLSSILCSLHDSSKPCIIVVLFLFSIVFVTEPFCGLIEPNNTICSIKLLFWSKLPQRGKLVPKQNM